MKKYNFLLLLAALFVCIFAIPAHAGTYSGGDGSEGNPYEIDNTDDLIELSNTSDDWGDYFIQTSDISFDEDETLVDWDGDGNADGSGTEGFSPIGNSTTKFTGSYDGQNHTIDNLFINRPSTDGIGLFGYTDDAPIENIGITNVDITGDHIAGALIGSSRNGGVSNCYSTGEVSGLNSIGGLIGSASSAEVSGSYSSCKVTGSGYSIGGLIGRNSNTIVNCYSTGDVEGRNRVGGLVGRNSEAVSQSYSTGSVSAEENLAGGLIGMNEMASIENCYSTSDVSLDWQAETVGAFIGSNGMDDDDFPSPGGNVSYCFATGDVAYDNGTDPTNKGFVGVSVDTDDYTPVFTANFFDSEASNQNSDAVGAATAQNTTEMQTQSTFQPGTNNWDFTNTWAMSSSITFNGYPTLQWTGAYSDEPSQSGNVYQISSLPNLVWIAEDEASWSNDYEQTADIDASTTSSWDDGKGWTPIGGYHSTNFTGSYDGDGHTINNLFINRSSTADIGLYGYTDGSSIENLGVVDVNITGGNNVGGLVGRINKSSTVSNCYSEGSVNSPNSESVGGLVGQNAASSTVSSSYSTSNVDADQKVGGLVGYNLATIENSYSTGSVEGNSDVGGLVGYNYSMFGTIDNSFWDTETSGQTNSDGGTGKTTSEMQDYNTFTDETTAGLDNAWDFVTNPNDDSSNDDYWDMDQLGTVNNGYPILSWQDGADDILFIPPYSGGSGNSTDPYEIDNTDDLIELSNTSGDWDKHFIQTADITFDADKNQVDWDGDGSADWDTEDQKGFSPIGNSTTNFTGSYDGQHYTIENLFINRQKDSNIGLFGRTNDVAISNVKLINVDITGADKVGGLAGWYYENTIINSYCSGIVKGSWDVGSLVARNESGTISNSFSSGNVEGSYNVGGLVGQINEHGKVSNSYSSASVTGIEYVGGLTGQNNQGTLSKSYSSGSVEGSNYVGGLVGYNADSITNSFWDTETSGLSAGVGNGDDSGVTGKTTSAMKDQSTFTGWTIDADNWSISDGHSRPYLSWQDVAVDNGYPENRTATSAEFPPGNIHNNIEDSVTISYGYIYKQDTPPTWDNNTKEEVGTESVASGANQDISSTTLSSLTSGTTYYARAYATDDTTVWYGDTVKFETLISVTISSGPNESGSVSPAGGDQSFPVNESVEITATPADGYQFDEWTADPSGNANFEDAGSASTSVTVTGEATITANFIPAMTGSGTDAAPYEIETWYDLNVVRNYLDSSFELQNDLDKDADGYDELVSADAVSEAVQSFGDYNGVPSGTVLELQTSPVEGISQVGKMGDLGIIPLEYAENLEDGTVTLDEDSDNTVIVTYTARGLGWSPIGDMSNPFYGNFDGNDKSISDLFINRPGEQYIGLFGHTREDPGDSPKLNNIRIWDADITGGEFVGTLIGSADISSHIEGVDTTGQVQGTGYVGGLIGALEKSFGTVIDCQADVRVTGTQYVGGLIGLLSGSKVENSTAHGDVVGLEGNEHQNFGGLVGFAKGKLDFEGGPVDIINSYATGAVHAPDADNVGC